NQHEPVHAGRAPREQPALEGIVEAAVDILFAEPGIERLLPRLLGRNKGGEKEEGGEDKHAGKNCRFHECLPGRTYFAWATSGSAASSTASWRTTCGWVKKA